MSARLTMLVLLLAVAGGPARAQVPASVEAAQLQTQLVVLDADPALGDKAPLERWKAKQAVAAIATVRARDRDSALYVARARVAAARLAAEAEQLQRQSAQLDRERDQIMVEASRREAELARREADNLRRQALAREEEAERAAAIAAVERAALEQSSLDAGATAEQAMKLAEARAEETRLARKEAELAAAVAADSLAGESAPPARTVGKSTIYTLPGTAFSSGSATLAPSAAASLRRQFSAIGAKKRLRVEAHTDSQGPDAANLALSKQRAEAVKRALVAAGIAAGRISAVGKGETAPVADNASTEGRARNRRVEIVVE